MEIKDEVSIKEGCRILGTYDQLLTGMAARHGVEIRRLGRIRYISRSGLETLRGPIAEWHNRPRLAELTAAAAP